jgi:hypothetical protein
VREHTSLGHRFIISPIPKSHRWAKPQGIYIIF